LSLTIEKCIYSWVRIMSYHTLINADGNSVPKGEKKCLDCISYNTIVYIPRLLTKILLVILSFYFCKTINRSLVNDMYHGNTKLYFRSQSSSRGPFLCGSSSSCWSIMCSELSDPSIYRVDIHSNLSTFPDCRSFGIDDEYQNFATFYPVLIIPLISVLSVPIHILVTHCSSSATNLILRTCYFFYSVICLLLFVSISVSMWLIPTDYSLIVCPIELRYVELLIVVLCYLHTLTPEEEQDISIYCD
jgi:hypothetical protein